MNLIDPDAYDPDDVVITWPSKLTSEPPSFEDDCARWAANAHLEAHRATEVRPCPAFARLDALMTGSGKVSADAPTPAVFGMRWGL